MPRSREPREPRATRTHFPPLPPTSSFPMQVAITAADVLSFPAFRQKIPDGTDAECVMCYAVARDLLTGHIDVHEDVRVSRHAAVSTGFLIRARTDDPSEDEKFIVVQHVDRPLSLEALHRLVAAVHDPVMFAYVDDNHTVGYYLATPSLHPPPV